MIFTELNSYVEASWSMFVVFCTSNDSFYSERKDIENERKNKQFAAASRRKCLPLLCKTHGGLCMVSVFLQHILAVFRPSIKYKRMASSLVSNG